MQKTKSKWLIFAVSGLLLIGAGLSICIDAAFLRFKEASSYFWILNGTIGLILFNSGICLFGQAVIFKVQMEDK